MNDTLKAIVRVLDEGSPELKVAASQILGELAPQDTAIVTALAGHLSLGDNTLNRYVLEALAKIGSPEAILILVSRLREGGGTADLVRHLLSSSGAAVADSLAASFRNETPELQAQLLQILGHHHTAGVMRMLMHTAFGDEPELRVEAGTFLCDRLAELDEKAGKKYREDVYKLVKSGKELAPEALANGLRAMAAVSAAQSRATLLSYAQPGHPPVVRQAALLGLENASLTAAQSDTLLGYLDEADQVHVVKPCLVALRGHDDWSRSGIKKLRDLLSSRREEMKLFALQAMQNTQSEEVAKIYMGHLTSSKPDLQAAAIQALGHNAKAVAMLLKSVQAERNADKARLLTRALVDHKDRLKPAQLTPIADRCGKHLADGAEVGEILLDFLMRVNSALACTELVEKAVRLRRARKLVEALRILMHLAKSGTLDLEGRYQLALARLIKDSEEGRSGAISYTGDATMGFIAGLVRDGFPVFERLKKETMLQPDDLLRVGRHFSAGIGPEQRLGADMLMHVAKKHPKAKAGEEARLMIRTEGLV
ncbi:MAG: hypothetical protein KDC87_11345 [Planctomycetes bacterium]|nr:hypothetical protein [Planctomycetota bacterium]MCB9870897.1 hypothetical protein [Planctomycetota bacterium]